MHVSISKLGANQSDAGGSARAVVEYLTGQQPRDAGQRGSDTPELADTTRPGSYYADSTQTPGRWFGKGTGTLIPVADRKSVRPEHLEALLLGQHPVTGEQLVGGVGSAGRTNHRHRVAVAAVGPPDELLSVKEAAALIDVDASYLRRILNRTHRARQGAADAGSGAETAKTYLDGIRTVGEGNRSGQGEWRIRRDEIERFVAARKEPVVVMGFDLTYSASKETSLAWAVADADGRSVIEAAFSEAAVSVAMAYVEDNAVLVRRGRGHEPGENMVAAAFMHTTSRELEPQLHVHVVIPNVVTAPDGRHQAIDARGIFAHAGTSGHLAEAEFKHIMAKAGYRFDDTVKGISHIQGIPEETVAAMSSGRARILAEVGAVGADSPAARQLAAWATRPAKNNSVDLVDLEANWAERFKTTGFTPEIQQQLTGHDGPRLWTPQDSEALTRHLAGPDGVTRYRGIFDRRHVIETIVDRVGDRLTAEEVLGHADRFLHSVEALKLDVKDGIQGDLIGEVGKVTITPGQDLYTTPATIRTERHLADAYRRGHDRSVGLVHPDIVTDVIAEWETRTGHRLGADQVAMVRAVTGSGDRFAAVVGPAGSGKTAALEVAGRAWERGGYRLFGAAVNGNAAEVLQSETGIESATVAGLLARLDAAAARGRPLLDADSVVIVDEASTLGNRAHSRLVRHVEAAGATMRSVGDPAQHRSVEAGGMWAHLARLYPDRTPELVENRRMTGPGMEQMRLAVAEYREGRIGEAIERINRDQRIVTAATGPELLDAMTADWYVHWRNHLANPGRVKPTRMLAENHAARIELNRRAQLILKAEGIISGEGHALGDSVFHVGDQVIARSQNRDLKAAGGDPKSYVRNGTKGTVVSIGDGPRPDLVVDFERRGPITVPYSWLTERIREGVTGGLTPAYAMTTHAAQGDTFTAGLSLVTDQSSPQGQYVAATRGQADVRLYHLDSKEFRPLTPAAEHSLPVVEAATGEPVEAIKAALTRPTPAHLATVNDTDIAAVMAYLNGGVSLANLEAVGSPLADRAARTLVERAAHRIIEAPPAPLVAMLGNRNPADAAHWDSAATSYALYHQRWGLTPRRGQIAAYPGPEDPARQHRDYRALKADLIRARAHHNRHLEPADLAAARNTMIAAGGPGTSHLDAGITGQLEGRVRSARLAVETRRQAHQAATARRSPDRAEEARRALAEARTGLAVAEAHLADHRSVVAARPALRAPRERAAMELAVLDRLVDGHAARAVTDTAPYRIRALGERPRDPEGAQRWGEVAVAVERYRIGVLGLGPQDGPAQPEATGVAHAVGERPTGPSAAAWDRVANQVAVVVSPAAAPRPGITR